jgi:spermidine synthase
MKNVFSEAWSKDTRFQITYTKHLYHEQTKFQKIDFYDSETYGRFFTLDDIMMLTEKDEFIYHDMISHVPMAVNPNIKRVLIIGGGDGGSAREMSRYESIDAIDMVEIDERVVRLCETYIPKTAGKLSVDPRIKLYFEDGLKFVENCKPNYYDLILVDSTDPIGPGEGLFTQKFYQHCYHALSEEGILINQHESPYFDYNANEMMRAHQKIKSLFKIASVYQFHQPTYPSGHWLFGFASKKYHPILNHQKETWEKLKLKTKYYNSELHQGAFCLPTYVKEMLENM